MHLELIELYRSWAFLVHSSARSDEIVVVLVSALLKISLHRLGLGLCAFSE